MAEFEAPELTSSQENSILPLTESDFERLTQECAVGQSSDGELTAIAAGEMTLLQNWSDFDDDHDRETVTEEKSAVQDVIVLSPDTQLIAPNAATGLNPSLQDWPGQFNFSIRLNQSEKAREPQFSPQLKKLYINQNQTTNVFFKIDPANNEALYDSLAIRCVAVFTKPDDLRLPVKVCPHHAYADSKLRSAFSDHLVHCTDQVFGLGHFTDSGSGRHFILMPFPPVHAGCMEGSAGFKFTDLSSCPGGINRRETAIIFTLETRHGEIVGRQVLHLRVCTSPRRDRQTEEKHFFNTLQQQLTKKIQVKSEEAGDADKRGNKRFWVLTSSEENFKVLSAMAELMEKKDGRDIKKWKDAMNSMNGGGLLPPKRFKTEDNLS